MKKEMNTEKRRLDWFMLSVIRDLKAEGHYPAAHVHRSCLRTLLVSFPAKKVIYLENLTPGFLLEFQQRLVDDGYSWNTVSTYLRTLRSVYHRAVRHGCVDYVPLLFKGVHTGVDNLKKRALSPETMRCWLTADTSSFPPELQKAHALFSLMFLLRGMPFIDLLHLRKQDIHDGVISYHRHKTGRQLCIAIPPEAEELIARYADHGDSVLLFPYRMEEPVYGRKDKARTRRIKKDLAARRSYDRELRKFNHNLARIAKLLGIEDDVSSYTPRHSWATIAFHRNASTAVIRGAMGHTTLKATEAYLKSLADEKIDEVNREIIDYIKNEVA